MIVFRNILNNYLIYINFKNVYYHLYKIMFFCKVETNTRVGA